eukprot:Skav216663  [mRNA]  locus=scaffold930:71363:72844:- [translate_table: standard]
MSNSAQTGSCACLPSSAENKTPLQGKSWDIAGARTQSWIYMILIAVTLAVAAIPEGIPLCVTISLAIGCKEMVEKNVQASGAVKL